LADARGRFNLAETAMPSAAFLTALPEALKILLAGFGEFDDGTPGATPFRRCSSACLHADVEVVAATLMEPKCLRMSWTVATTRVPEHVIEKAKKRIVGIALAYATGKGVFFRTFDFVLSNSNVCGLVWIH
jgi:hypothetical protein